MSTLSFRPARSNNSVNLVSGNIFWGGNRPFCNTVVTERRKRSDSPWNWPISRALEVHPHPIRYGSFTRDTILSALRDARDNDRDASSTATCNYARHRSVRLRSHPGFLENGNDVHGTYDINFNQTATSGIRGATDLVVFGNRSLFHLGTKYIRTSVRKTCLIGTRFGGSLQPGLTVRILEVVHSGVPKHCVSSSDKIC